MDDIYDIAPIDPKATFLSDVLSGLSKPQKTLPCQYFYDETGSELFEEITQLDEYYPTRTEMAILRDHVEEISGAIGTDVLLVEYGAGASTKTRILLDALSDPAGYVPIDVSEAFLLQTAEGLRADYPDLKVHPIVGDFMVRFGLPQPSNGRPVGFFPGSTIGNLSDPEIDQFMQAARTLLGADGQFILGVDLRKSPDILIPAYDDAAGTTARFNLNLLTRINRELGASFDLSGFAHKINWNDTDSRIEMHLESLKAQTVSLGEEEVLFEAGETIHTENSRKFDLVRLRDRLSHSGWRTERVWQDENDYFAIVLLTADSDMVSFQQRS
ncbi:MAG: L-histidine N(alpha)-methyltransferase [Pseudomonadota bacterium]